MSFYFLIDQLAHPEALIFVYYQKPLTLLTKLYHIYYYLSKNLYLHNINLCHKNCSKNIELISINSLLKLNCYL
jgi:hypothetical protein